MTWTRLDSTANAGDTQITLQHSVGWQVGDEIVIASTGHRHSQAQNEKHTISAVSPNGKTLTLESALKFKHVGETVPLISGHELGAFAEVGLLTRNVVVRGSNHKEWNDVIEACPEGFNTGELMSDLTSINQKYDGSPSHFRIE